ncbi:M16 family metallopeptidase [Legionella sp. CNM-4043-24]|uniref:M16 family metallopeptidase n=1 Tax=Legionella sp. CNM-4043-24 TaxID=3421646 RepID=UPI00403AE804
MKKWLITLAVLAFSIHHGACAAQFKTERWQTAKGARVVFYKAMDVPMLYINVAFAAGSAYDGNTFGISALTAQLLNQGSGSLNSSQMAEKLADVGAQYNSETSRDMTVLQLKTLTKPDALNQAVDTLSMIINKPAFRQDAFNRQKNQQLIAISREQESPDSVANIVFFNKLYQNHPYAHAINGNANSVRALTIRQVRDFHKRYYAGSNAVIVLAGAIDSDKAHQIAEQLTQGMEKGEPAAAIPKANRQRSREDVIVPYPSSQNSLRLGQIGISHDDPEYFPLMVGNYILGGGSMTSRLSQEVREKRGLTYGISSQFIPMPGDGPFIISLSTKNSQTSTALQVTEETLAGFLASGPSEEELMAAKQYMVGSYPLSLASNGDIASILLRTSFYNLPEDYLDTYIARVENVSVADIKKAFDSHIQQNDMLLVSVGAEPSAAKGGEKPKSDKSA